MESPKIRRRLARDQTPPFVDGQIMVIAHVNGLILVTFNPKDHMASAQVKVEDWNR